MINYNFYPGKYNTPKDKYRIFEDWKYFVASNFEQKHFTKRLYKHLSLHCGFIAHYNINGFYEARFEDIEGRLTTFEQIADMGHHMLSDDCTSDNGDLNTALKDSAQNLLGHIQRDYRDRVMDDLILQKHIIDKKLEAAKNGLST
jgi:hypothetical protein